MSASSRYGRLRYGIGRYGGTDESEAPPARQPATLPQPGARPLAATSALRAPVLPQPGGRPSDPTPGTGAS